MAGLNENDLMKLDQKVLVQMLLMNQQMLQSLKETNASLNVQLEVCNQKLDILMEQLQVARSARFGRSSEKVQVDGQMELCFNEAEITIAEAGTIKEPTIDEACPCTLPAAPARRKKSTGKREADLSGYPTTPVHHLIDNAVLDEKLGKGWRQLPDEVYKRLEFHPATYEVKEHHVGVYVSADGKTFMRGDRPADLLRNSILTPSLAAAIMNAKYINAVPINRLEQEFKRYDVHISRQVMCNWIIHCAERYLSLLYDRLHKELYKGHVIQADETPCEVNRDGRPAGAKSYMWVYRSGRLEPEHPVVLYEYQKTRKQDHPREFLKDFTGTVLCDGYQVYHSIENEIEDLKVAGCWAHARRRFANAIKAMKGNGKGTIAGEALERIASIYNMDNELAALPADERARRRQQSVKPLTEAFFAWVKECVTQVKVTPGSETGKGLSYCINQEKYLKTFLDNGWVPMDNNAAEQSIRGFCIGKKNWMVIDTIAGAKASAIIYSIAETAKLNHLKPYNYFEFLLTELPELMEEQSSCLEQKLNALLPWSETLPVECRKKI